MIGPLLAEGLMWQRVRVRRRVRVAEGMDKSLNCVTLVLHVLVGSGMRGLREWFAGSRTRGGRHACS